MRERRARWGGVPVGRPPSRPAVLPRDALQSSWGFLVIAPMLSGSTRLQRSAGTNTVSPAALLDAFLNRELRMPGGSVGSSRHEVARSFPSERRHP
jgi:hypothetical protein